MSEADGPRHPDVEVFVDEAGVGGFVRNLTGAKAGDFCLMAGLPIPLEYVDTARKMIEPHFNRFCDAAPAHAKPHITDAFRSDDERWRSVAHEVRESIVSELCRAQCRVIYVARRHQVALKRVAMHGRASFEARDGAEWFGPSQYAVPGRSRPAAEKVFDQVMLDFAYILEVFMRAHRKQLADLHIDNVDDEVIRCYRSQLATAMSGRVRRISIPRRNLVSRQTEEIVIETTLNADFDPDASHLGKIVVAGKSDPLIFAADVVANSLWRHLKQLPRANPLNSLSSIAGWRLEPNTFCDRRPNAPLSTLDQF